LGISAKPPAQGRLVQIVALHVVESIGVGLPNIDHGIGKWAIRCGPDVCLDEQLFARQIARISKFCGNSDGFST
jgi:hypothetical protein